MQSDSELDELELGERVADALFYSEMGNIYTYPEDRAWEVVAQCYRAIVQRCDPVPEGWYPQINEKGRWVYARP